MKFEYYETSLASIVEYFVKGFKLKKGEWLWKHEICCDPGGKIILKLFIIEEEKDEG